MPPTNNTRPTTFDAALTSYLPSLRKQAAFIAGDNGDDLLQDAVVSMLHLAPKCRMETFKTWAQIILRRTAGNNKRLARAAKRQQDPMFAQASAPASQEAHAELSEALAALSTIKHGEIVLRRAMGDLLKDIGTDRGTNREAVRQLEVKARRALTKRMAA